MCVDVFRALAFLLGGVDEPLHLPCRKALIVDVHLLHQPLDERQLILTVENLKRLRQPCLTVMRSQHAVAQAMKRAHPHAARVDGQHGRQTGLHLLGGLVGEGHRHDAGRRDLARLQQPRDARGQHARLAGTRPGQNEQRPLRGRDSRQLLGVEPLEQAGGMGFAGLSVLIEQALSGRIRLPTEIRKLQKSLLGRRMNAIHVPPRVVVDNHASNRFTVIEVNGRDRPGLLHDVTAAISDQGMQIASAHVTTYGVRAVDVFYIKDVFGLKVENERKKSRTDSAIKARKGGAPMS